MIETTKALDEKEANLETLRKSLKDSEAHARSIMNEAETASIRATSMKDSLLDRCEKLKATPGNKERLPAEELGNAMLTASERWEVFQEAQEAHRQAQEAVEAHLPGLDDQILKVRRERAAAIFHAAVVEFEKTLKEAQLGRLSDEIRKLADNAGIVLEAHSPLLNPDFLTIAGYPIRAW